MRLCKHGKIALIAFNKIIFKIHAKHHNRVYILSYTCKHTYRPMTTFKNNVRKKDHVYLRHLSTEYRSILSADMSAESRPIYRPTLGRDSVNISTDINRHTCWPTPGRYFTATRPPLGRYFTDTQPTLRSFAQLSLLSSIFSAQLRGLSGPSSFFGLQLRKHSCLFSSYVFSLRRHFCIQPSLLSEVAAFRACCLWRFVILGEQKMIYKVSTIALSFCHIDGFFSSRPCDI